jgi:hypothetical protein
MLELTQNLPGRSSCYEVRDGFDISLKFWAESTKQLLHRPAINIIKLVIYQS